MYFKEVPRLDLNSFSRVDCAVNFFEIMSSYLAWDMMLRAQLRDIARTRDRRSRNRNSVSRGKAFDMTNREFIKTYRLSKTLARNLINELRPFLHRTRRSDAISPEDKVLIALAFFATGSYQTITSQCRVHAVSQPTVSRAIKEVVGALNRPDIINKYIVFPLTQAGREQIKTQFYSKFNIPGVVGCIDGTHVSIIKPTENEERFVNRKGYHSLNVQIICDVNLNILSVDASHPGSTHDSVIWGEHPLNQYLQGQLALGENFYLLGDSGYALRANMMTPILNALPGTPEEHYCNLHVTARNTVERCIGVLKARFRCLLSARQLHYDPVSAARIVNACCILHNIANNATMDVPPLTSNEMAAEIYFEVHSLESRRIDSNRRQNHELQDGRAVQQSLVNRLWEERQRR